SRTGLSGPAWRAACRLPADPASRRIVFLPVACVDARELHATLAERMNHLAVAGIDADMADEVAAARHLEEDEIALLQIRLRDVTADLRLRSCRARQIPAELLEYMVRERRAVEVPRRIRAGTELIRRA